MVSPTAANHRLHSGETSSCDFGQYVEGKICSISRTSILANAKSWMMYVPVFLLTMTRIVHRVTSLRRKNRDCEYDSKSP